MGQVLRGIDLKLYINNNPFGRVTAFSVTIDHGRSTTRTIDSALPVELATGPVSVTITLEVIRLRSDGGLEGSGIAPPVQWGHRERYITLRLLDRRTDKIVFGSNRASIKAQSWRTQSKSLLTGSITIECLDISTGA